MTVAGTRWTTLALIFFVTSAATALIVVILAQGRGGGSSDPAAVSIGPAIEANANVSRSSTPGASDTPTPVTERTSGRAITDPLAAGAVEGPSTSDPATPAVTATPPTAGPDETARLAIEAPLSVGTGETMAVRVASAAGTSANATFAGDTTPLVWTGDGFWGLVGVSVNATLGEQVLAVTVQDAAGTTVDDGVAFIEVTYTERPVDYLELTEEQSSVLSPEASQRERDLRSAQFAQFDGPPQWDGTFIQPIAGRHTTSFGEGRSYNGGPVGNFHTGEDIAAELGTPVGAAARGRVAWTGEMPIRGNSVIIDHGGGVKTGYHHLNSISVNVGDILEQGWEVGRVGSTGLSTGPHLHWELTVWGVNVDPMAWIDTPYQP
ncbi:MAG: peptidoglycan DD-metalloendopeptidase family protein [Dehalococcoidia bacterium]